MALRAFHANPGIGGFGESTTTNTTLASKNYNDFEELSSSCNKKKKKNKKDDSDDDHDNDKCGRENSNGNGDLLCQIVKELVDNAVDACKSSCNSRYDHHDKEEEEERRRRQGGGGGRTSTQNRNQKRIKIEISRPPNDADNNNDSNNNSILQVTVSDNGCGMESIQDCVNAFHSSKRGDDDDESDDNNSINVNNSTNSKNNNNSENHTSGRYGIGLTLCILHAQRCVPNSRVCITSVSAKSKYRTRAIFEVDKQGDSVDCVQEEVTPVTTSEYESGTCVSLLVPGGIAAKLAWPRLNDYFTRFRLCTNLHFELHVFAPTLTKFPIYIRPQNWNAAVPLLPSSGHEKVVTNSAASSVAETQSQERQHLNDADNVDDNDDEQWGDLLDDINEEEEDKGCDDEDDDEVEDKDGNDNEKRVHGRKGGNRKDNTGGKSDSESDRYAFFKAAKSFWPERNIAYKNVARSVRNIPRTNYSSKENATTSELQLEVHMVVCPYPKQDEENSSGSTSATGSDSSSSSFDDDINTGDYAVRDRKVATLKLIRMVNGVPILDSGEAHSCGLVHGVANKIVWGSFGLDVTKNAATIHETCDTPSRHPTTSTPSFQLRDSNIIAPFINRNINHRQLRASNRDMINNDNEEEDKKRKRDDDYQDGLLPANIRIGTILLVVQIRAAPSALPLPTLSKGRLPLNHRPIDSALQLGLRDCLRSLQGTNQSLFLTSTRLRAIEREVRYIPGIASAISRIVCRSANLRLRRKSQEIFKQISTEENNNAGSKAEQQHIEVVSTNEEPQELVGNDINIDVRLLSNAFQTRLRLAMQVRDDLITKPKRCSKKHKDTNVDDDDEQEYDDFDSDEDSSKHGMEAVQPSTSETKTGPLSVFSSSHEPEELGMESVSSSNSSLSQGRAFLKSKFVVGSDAESSATRPVKEILVDSDLVIKENEYDFDDW